MAIKIITVGKAKATAKKAEEADKPPRKKPGPKPGTGFISNISDPKWLDVREEFIQSIIKGKRITMRALAEKHGFAEQSVTNRAHREKWVEQANLRKDQLQVDRELVWQVVQDEYLNAEVEVRKRHAQLARGLQAKAIQALKLVSPAALRPMAALKMLELGFIEERRALGLPDTYVQVENVTNNKTPEGYKPLVAQFENHKKVQELGMQLLSYLKNKGDPKVSELDVLENGALPVAGEVAPVLSEDDFGDGIEEVDDSGTDDDEPAGN